MLNNKFLSTFLSITNENTLYLFLNLNILMKLYKLSVILSQEV
jgi:hypothetical protein